MDPTTGADLVNRFHVGTWAAELGLVVTAASGDEVRGSVEVQPKHHQPYGLVHGGVYAAIVESIASIGAGFSVMEDGRSVVGLDNSTSFLRAVRSGTLTAVGTPLTRGRRTQLWEVAIRDADGALVATGRVRLLVVEAGGVVAGKALQLPNDPPG